MTADLTPVVEAAHSAVARGWKVVPVHAPTPKGCTCTRTECSSPGKHPRINEWQHDASRDSQQVDAWFTRWPDSNVGILTGEPSGVIVVDVDLPDGETSLQSLIDEHGPVPQTLQVRTGSGGRHLYFRRPGEEIRNSVGRIGAGIDVRADGGYIILPPSRHASGDVYAWIGSGAEPVADMPNWLRELLIDPTPPEDETGEPQPLELPPAAGASYAAAALRNEVASVAEAVVGTRNDTLNRAAFSLGQLVGSGLVDQATVEDTLLDAAMSAGLPPNEATATIGSGMRAGRARPRRLSSQAGPNDYSVRRLTDLGNAERFVDQHGPDVRHITAWRSWLEWDGVRWSKDETNAVVRRMKATVRSIYQEATRPRDPDLREAVAKHAIKSEHERRITAALKLAASEQQVVLKPSELDADPWVLCVNNGVIDLRTGQLRPHRREDLITRLAPVTYDPEADQSEWLSFLRTATDDDEELIAYLRRAVGYSLTGDTAEEVAFFVHGPGATGKSTMVDAIRSAVGAEPLGYSMTSPFETFLKSRYAGSPRNDLARLNGARAVFAVEVDEGKALDTGVLKSATGGDAITARFLYKEFFSFRPQFTLWLVANHRPRVDADDDAIWRRLKIIPFEHVVPEGRRDPEVKKRLRDPEIGGPAVLAWAVQGCLEWQRDGLGQSPRVARATDRYRHEMDPLDGFVGEVIEPADGEWLAARVIHAEHQRWAMATGKETVDTKIIASLLYRIGAVRNRRGGKHGWLGVQLVSDRATPNRRLAAEQG